jgi:hypothetical protein
VSRYGEAMSDELSQVAQADQQDDLESMSVRGMSEQRLAIAVGLQAIAMDGGHDQNSAARLALRVMDDHSGQIHSWASIQRMVAEVRAAAQGGK